MIFTSNHQIQNLVSGGQGMSLPNKIDPKGRKVIKLANIHRDNTITFNRNIIMFQFLQKPFSNILFTIYTTKI